MSSTVDLRIISDEDRKISKRKIPWRTHYLWI